MSFDIDQDAARMLFAEGGVLVFLGVPEDTEFGIDMKSWNTAEDFRGIKMIPPGLHYIHYSAASKISGDVAPRVGFMHHFKKREVVVKMWDKEREDISKDEVSEESVQRIKDNLLNLDRYLAPYPFEIWQKWKDLSYQISDNLVSLLIPENGQIRSALELLSCSNDDRPRGINKQADKKPSSSSEPSSQPTTIAQDENTIKSVEVEVKDINPKMDSKETNNGSSTTRLTTAEAREDALLPNLKPAPGTAIRFTELPNEKYPPGSTPQEITKHYLDETYVLEYLMSKHTNTLDLVGELQFSYVCFLIGQSLDAFEHWKKLVTVFCSCEEAIKKYRNVYMHFISTLETQINEIPEEFLADIVMNNNLVYKKLRDFFKTVHNCDVEGRLKTAIERFMGNLTEKFEWDFTGLEAEEDDERPVIVDL